MDTHIIDGTTYGAIGKRHRIASPRPRRETRLRQTVIRLGDDGWAIAADLTTPLGKLTRRATEAIEAPFIDLTEVPKPR